MVTTGATPGGASANAAGDGSGAGEFAGFDPARARGAVRRVPIRRVVDPLAVTHAADVVDAYRAAMRAGERFPPIGVLAFAGRFWVADGHKRLAACRGLAPESIDVEIWPLSRWFADQGRQVKGAARRLGRALRLLGERPREGWDLLAAAPRHWWRVARSLVTHAGRVVSPARESRASDSPPRRERDA